MNSPRLKLAKGCGCVLCAGVEAYHANKAPKLVLEATHESMLELVPLEVLKEFAINEI